MLSYRQVLFFNINTPYSPKTLQNNEFREEKENQE